MPLISLNKFISQCSIGSRRKTGELIKDGQIRVNQTIITHPGHRIDTEKDMVYYNNKLLKKAEYIYLLLNKPKDYITTLSDERGRKNVIQLVHGATSERIYPVGRLDRNTTGLLLLTNDGQLAQKLAHPRYEIQKVYHATLHAPLKQTDFDKIKRGLILTDGPISINNIHYLPENKKQISIELHSGRNRIVRRIFAQCGYEVIKLDRVNYAGLTKKDLHLGQWRFLTPEEITSLKNKN